MTPHYPRVQFTESLTNPNRMKRTHSHFRRFILVLIHTTNTTNVRIAIVIAAPSTPYCRALFPGRLNLFCVSSDADSGSTRNPTMVNTPFLVFVATFVSTYCVPNWYS